MNLHERIKRLERRTSTGTTIYPRKALRERLAVMEARSLAGGDYEHKESASVAENLVRARLRGDFQATAAIWRGIFARLRPNQVD